MKRLLFICSAFVMLSSCHYTTGSGNIISKQATKGNFKSISVSGGIEVEFITGTNFEVRLEADDNVIDHMEADVDDGVLELEVKGLHNTSNIHLKAYVTAPYLNSVRVDGGSSFNAKGIFKNINKIEFEANGGASIHADVDAPAITAEANGGGSIELSGRTKNYEATADGGGEITSANLLSEVTKANANGGGTAYVHASIKLIADADGGGSIHYSGGASVEKSVSGGGSVSKND